MKRIIYATAFLVIAFFGIAATSTETCDTKTLKKEGIAELNPYFYSAAKVNTINYDNKETSKEIEVPLFKGEKYKMVFNKKALPKDVIVEIYDKDNTHDGRAPLYSSKDASGDIITFEPKKSRKMYVNYLIPKVEGEKVSGCLVFILGYQLTFLEDYNSNN